MHLPDCRHPKRAGVRCDWDPGTLSNGRAANLRNRLAHGGSEAARSSGPELRSGVQASPSARAWLIRKGKPGLAMELLRLPLNRIGVRALYAEARAEGLA